MEALLHWAEKNVGQVLDAQRRYDEAQAPAL